VIEVPLASTPYVWTLRPAVIAAVAIGAVAYAWRFRETFGGDRRARPARARDYLRAASFAAGLVVVILALDSPVDSLGEERLFSVHMLQHLLIADIAPILLLVGLSRVLMRPAVKRLQGLERALGPVAQPLTALFLFVAVLSIWHLPAMYELALRNDWAHELEHASFFAAGIGFWWYVIEPVPPRHRLQGGGLVAYIASAKIMLSLLGVILAFSPTALYDTYERAPRTWGLSAVADLNIGGLLMMAEQSVILLITFAVLLGRMLDQSERGQLQRERLMNIKP
jgi:putative membrane protein